MDAFGDSKRLCENSTGSGVFDASQYAFFGNDVVEEVELGGLEDDDNDGIPAVALEDEYQFDQEEGDGLGSYSDLDDLSSTFSKLNKAVSEPRLGSIISDWGSRESPAAAEWVQDVDYTNWYDQRGYHPENLSEVKRWSSQPYSSPHFSESKPIHRTSSYPDPEPQFLPQHYHNFPSEPIPVSKASFPSYPPSRDNLHMGSPNHHGNLPHNSYLPGGPQMALQSQPSFSGPPSGLPFGPQFTNKSQFSHSGYLSDTRPPHQWPNRANHFDNSLPMQLPHQNGMRPPQLMGQSQQQQQQQHRMHRQIHPSFSHLTGLPPQLMGPHGSPPLSFLNKLDAMMGIPDIRDQRGRPPQKNRQNLRCPQQGFDTNQGGDGPWPVLRSKYMTGEEIEYIMRTQLAATHSNEPYVDDYYHQACLARKIAGARLKHHFCPTQLRDLPPRARPSDEPHPFLQVEALGRIPFSSIRRPKPLLEVDPPSSSSAGSNEKKIIDKPLEQEPMLAARVAIEDCLCLLLDIDDIDRFLQFNQFPDGGSELRKRRQSQLEGLAASLQLVDPLGKGGQTPNDDFVFIRILSLPKGRKLLGKYIEALSPESDLVRIVCMAVFRHLRFLFGVLPSDPAVAEVTANLAKIVSSCVSGMDLNGLSACLAAVVCSLEPPPLRPIGSSAGDGASVVLKAILDRATELVRDPRAVSSYNTSNPAFWQASFDEFFSVLLKYCFNKYDSIVQPMLAHGSLNMAAPGSDVARAIKREMPVELLRASLPHTSDHQQKLLMELAQRAVPLGGAGGNGAHDG